MKISVVVPVYNEAQRILPSLEQVFAYMDRHHPEYEVVVVDDGSDDDTAGLVRQGFADRSQLHVLAYGGNRGKGYAVRYGALHATGEVVLFSDADLSTPMNELEKMLRLIEDGCEVVIASRAHALAEIRQRQPIYREGVGKLFNLLVRWFLLPGFHDTQCGFKCFRRERMLPVLNRLQIDGFAFDVELLVGARNAGLKIGEVPVVWVNSPTSKVQLARGLAAFVDLVRIYRRAKRAAAPASDHAEARP